MRLTVGGRVYRQPVVIRMDPRVKTPPADLALQFKLSKSIDGAIRDTAAARTAIRARLAGATPDVAARLTPIRDGLDAAAEPLQRLFETLQAADARPTAAAEAAVADALQHVSAALAAFRNAQ